MLNTDIEASCPSAKKLVKEQVASRISNRDATLFDFSEDSRVCAESYMGWADLATKPPFSIVDIQNFANKMVKQGLKTVVLIGQGGSTQAPMTITKYNKQDSNGVSFKTLDSVSPVRIRGILSSLEFETTLFIVSSKSGGTIEPRLILEAVRGEMRLKMDDKRIASRLVAITDPGTALEKQALEEGWLAVFQGEPSVGGRFSALSVFGLLPAAMVGLDLGKFIECAKDAEVKCSEDAIDNPAIVLASYLYDNYKNGRNKLSFYTPKRGRVLGLWIEQLVAESLGKDGTGIVPNIDIDTLSLIKDTHDRAAIVYLTKADTWDERNNFEMGLGYIDSTVPRRTYVIENVYELAEHFVMWEYATAMCGYLMEVCPFDQPDVASLKSQVLSILSDGMPEPDFVDEFLGNVHIGDIEVSLCDRLREKSLPAHDAQEKTGSALRFALKELLSTVSQGDFFATCAFLPFSGEGRREALEQIRWTIGSRLRVASCMEIGPRYLHSTGQLYKGGVNSGVFLVISADELKDIPLESGADAVSLGALAKAQAVGDLMVMSANDRRALHFHLPDNSAVTLKALANLVSEIVEEIEDESKSPASIGLGSLSSTDVTLFTEANTTDRQDDTLRARVSVERIRRT